MENDAKMSSNINILPSYEKLNFEKCTFSFRRHIINHIDNIQEIKKHLLSFSLDGKTGIELMRSFSWKIYLNVLSSDENATLKTWLEETFNMRNEFNKKVKELMNIKKYRGDPLGGFDGGQWGDFFDKADIKHLIKIDVDRTFQDRDLFCENSIKDMEYNILYLFAKVNQPTSYKQGMNDILAMLIYSLYPYYRKSKINEYNNELFDKWVENPTSNIDDIYNFFHDENYFQSDLFYLRVNLMNFGVNKFYEDVDETKNPGESKNYLVKRCENISEKKLKLQNSRLYYHFVNIGIDPGVVLQRWIKCLFTREFHPQDCSIIWDAIFANEIMEPSEDLNYVDYFSIAMLDFISDELLRKDQSECFKRLFQYPPLESMTTLISLTSRIKPKIIELEKLEIQREKEWKEKTIRNKKQLEKMAEQNKKLKKELEENLEKNKQNATNNINNINNFLFANQFNLFQNPNIFINNNAKYLSPQLNNIQNQNQQIFPQMNIMFNNSTNMLININNINNSKKKAEKNNKKEKKENKEDNNKNKSPLDFIKTTYSESIEDKNKLFEELKSIMNKYKSTFTYNDRIKADALLDKLQKKL